MRKKNERERKKKQKGFRLSLQSTEIGWLDLVGPRVKAHLLSEGYAWAPKSRSFDVVPDFRFSRRRKFRVKEVSTGLPRDSSTPQEVGVSSYSGYF